MNAERDPSWKPEMHVGGFAAHCSNQSEQRWFIESNPEAQIIRVRLGKNGWKDKNGNSYRPSDKPRRFYDYNF